MMWKIYTPSPRKWGSKKIIYLMQKISTFLGMTVVVAATLLSGCSSPPSKFYVLSSLNQLQAAIPKRPLARCLYLGVGPIKIPRYLQTPQVVVRLTNNQVHLSEFHRWAEPLRVNVESVLAQNLRWLLGVRHIVKYPWSLNQRVDLHLKVSIVRFDTDAKGLSVLVAHWRLLDKHDKQVYLTNSANFQQLAKPQNYHSIIASMNNNLANLSEDIASDIRKLFQKYPNWRRRYVRCK